MKKFVFSLEKVLSYKRQSLDLLKNELAQLRVRLNDFEVRIDGLNLEFENHNHNLIVKLQTGMAPRNIAVYKNYLSTLDRKVKLLTEQKQQIVEAIEAKQQEVVRMNSDISGLERLRDKQLQEYLAQERKEQEHFIEEFVGRTGTQAAG